MNSARAFAPGPTAGRRIATARWSIVSPAKSLPSCWNMVPKPSCSSDSSTSGPGRDRKDRYCSQRFHGWLHRKLVAKVKERAEEACLRTEFVPPAGTSKYAFDGSGEVKRDPKKRALVTFPNSKRYDADLFCASYNIGARLFARMLGLSAGNGKACGSGRSSRTQLRIPVTPSTLWLRAQSSRAAEREAPSTAPSGA